MAQQRICKKCLLKEMSEDEYFHNLYTYIENMDADLKCSDEEYQRRLAICKECDSLESGMCRVCGCFVELRAVMKNKSCPGLAKSW